MHGRAHIVLRLENHGFYEHTTLASATQEAKRLTLTVGGEFVVYAPVRAVTTEPVPQAVVRDIRLPRPDGYTGCAQADGDADDEDDDLPF